MRRTFFVLAAAALGAFACVSTLPADGYPCPCADGWQCCAASNVCIPQGRTCPVPACVPDCSSGRCGPNECGTSCGACVCNGKTCREDQMCTPVGRCGLYVGATRPPKVMLVVDKSGSMKTVASSETQWGCANDQSGNGYDPVGDCKWNTLKQMLVEDGGFLDAAGSQARIGLAIFSGPSGFDACSAGEILVPVPESPGASKEAIRSKLDSVVPAGGTPMSSTLNNIAADFDFMKKEQATPNFVVLITDGSPNCNASLAGCAECTNGGNPAQMCGDVRNCLDDVALASAVSRLRAKDVFTLVIGIGTVFSNPVARKALDDAAIAGGMPQSDAPTKFYFASTNEDLGNILKKIVPSIGTCLFTLESAPSDPDSLEVVLTDSTLAAPGNRTDLVRGADWDYTDDTHTAVAIKGAQCLVIQTAEKDRYQLSFLEMKPL